MNPLLELGGKVYVLDETNGMKIDEWVVVGITPKQEYFTISRLGVGVRREQAKFLNRKDWPTIHTDREQLIKDRCASMEKGIAELYRKAEDLGIRLEKFKEVNS